MKNKEENQDPISLIDLDGTLADYDTAMQRDLDSMRSPNEPEIHKQKEWKGEE